MEKCIVKGQYGKEEYTDNVVYLNNSEMIEFSRSSSYIGTLIDDLVTKDIEEEHNDSGKDDK